MDYLKISKKGSNLHVEDFPNAVKIIELKDKKSKRLADLNLHQHDLRFALDCLNKINDFLDDDQFTIREALWRSAIVHFSKCFGGNRSRGHLDASKIFGNNETAVIVFNYFKSLRNKHVVHDDNPYTQCQPGAVLNKPHEKFKIAKVITLAFNSITLDQNNWANLHSSVSAALEWAVKEFDDLANSITRDLEAIPCDELLKQPSPKMKAPTANEVHETRAQNKNRTKRRRKK